MPIQFLSAFLTILFICYTMLMNGISQLVQCRDILIQDGDGNIIVKSVMFYAGAHYCSGQFFYQSAILWFVLGVVFPLGFYNLLRRQHQKYKRNSNELVYVPWYA